MKPTPYIKCNTFQPPFVPKFLNGKRTKCEKSLVKVDKQISKIDIISNKIKEAIDLKDWDTVEELSATINDIRERSNKENNTVIESGFYGSLDSFDEYDDYNADKWSTFDKMYDV